MGDDAEIVTGGPPPDYTFIAITPPGVPVDGAGVDLCKAAEAGGATALQVRLKAAPASAILGFAERLVGTLQIPVYVNDRADAARAAGAAGVHLGADDLPPEVARRAVPRPMRLGVSVGTPEEAAAAHVADADYWSIGPFYPTAVKADAGGALGPSGFRRLLSLAPSAMPVIAIGGIGAGQIPEVVSAGAAGVAVVSGVFGARDVERAARAIRRALDAAG